MNLLKQVLTKKIFTICETGIEFYAQILGSLRKELTLRGFTVQQTQEIILTLLNSKHKK